MTLLAFVLLVVALAWFVLGLCRAAGRGTPEERVETDRRAWIERRDEAQP